MDSPEHPLPVPPDQQFESVDVASLGAADQRRAFEARVRSQIKAPRYRSTS